MALGKNNSLGLVKRTGSFGRKRILILNDTDIESIDMKKPSFGTNSISNVGSERSPLEALPQDILVRILCGVEHDDLKRLFHVSKPIREAVMIAKKCHFAFSTPKKIPAFRCSLNAVESQSLNFDETEAPNAPKQSRVTRSRLDRKRVANLSVALFADEDEDEKMNKGLSKRGLFSETDL